MRRGVDKKSQEPWKDRLVQSMGHSSPLTAPRYLGDLETGGIISEGEDGAI